MKTVLPFLLVLVAFAALFTMPLIVKHATAFVKDVIAAVKAPAPHIFGQRLKQGGFVTLLNDYQGYTAGSVVELPKSTEDSLIAAGQATTSAGPATAGAFTTVMTSGAATIAAGQSSVVITNPKINVSTKMFAVVAQAAADGTLLRVERVVCSAGFATIYGTANATAATQIDWAIVNNEGTVTNPT